MSRSVHPILARWQGLSRWPGGKLLFNMLLGRMVPYTGTVRPCVVELQPGQARIEMADRRRVRNHLRSVHAVALLNLAEVTSGLAMTCGLPRDARGIVTRLTIDYEKKARGRLTGTSRCEPPTTSEEREIEVVAEIHDAQGDRVARAVARWKIGPRC